MDFMLGKIKKQGTSSNTLKKMISDTSAFTFHDSFINHTEYSPNNLLDEDSWYSISEFSTKEFCIPLLQSGFNSTDYLTMEKSEANSIAYLVSYQDNDKYYFQNITKNSFVKKKTISIGDQFTFNELCDEIVINELPDALYIKSEDRLYFKKLSLASHIFKGIEVLYREATQQEVEEFLSKEFIELAPDITAEKIKIPNRKRIALALSQLENFEHTQKKIIFDSIKEYCPNLVTEDDKFHISTEDDLKLLLYGIGQRFYTTPDGKEKRIANSIITM